MDQEISKQTQKLLSKQGMKFKLNTKVVEGDDSGSGVKINVEAAKGGKAETVCSLIQFAPPLIHMTGRHESQDQDERI